MNNPDWLETRRDYDEELHEEHNRRYRGCVCDPHHDMPGTCPGADVCPLNQTDEEETL